MNYGPFSKDNRWLLPEGVDEVLPPDAATVEALRRSLLDAFQAWGYDLVMPPTIEFLESLLTGAGHDLDIQTFKLTDQLSGRMMGVRADMTPQAARIDAHKLRRDTPTRLCYIGTVLQSRPEGPATSRNPIQVGCELFGHGGVEADIEVISLMLETLSVAGIGDCHLDLGHVGIFRGLAADAGLNADAENRLWDALQRKAVTEIDELLGALELSGAQRRMLRALADLSGGIEVLDEANRLLADAPDPVQEALAALWSIATSLERRLPDVALHFDLGELRGYAYHTGAVFAAFVPGHGEEVARGGRYDQIGRVFGRSRPATGFSADLKTLMALGSGGAAATVPGIQAPWEDDTALLERVRALRDAGERVVWRLPGQRTVAGCDRQLIQHSGQWRVEPLKS